MKFNRLTAAITLLMATTSAAQAATYRVIELPLSDKGVNSFAAKINNTGDVAALITQPKNPPIDVELVNFDDNFLVNNLTDLNGAQVGNINTDDLLLLFQYVSANADSFFSQKLATIHSYLFDGSDVQFVPGFDVISSDLEGYTFSNNTTVRGINDSTALVGTSVAPYYKVDYQTEFGLDLTYVVQDYTTRGFLDINGNIVPVLPTETTLGGISEAYDINNGFEVAGFGSVDVSEAFEQQVEDCQDEDVRIDVPEEACFQSLFNGNFAANFDRRAMIWQYDANGNLLDERELGLLFTPEDTDTNNYFSQASAINENGIAVGISNDQYREDPEQIGTFAAIFDGEEVIGFTDHQDYVRSVATDINNNDIVVGQAYSCLTFTEESISCIANTDQTHFFYHDYRGEFTEYPRAFFDSSNSVARAINDNGLIVGEAEVDSNATGSRRREGFIYDINSDTFTNINDLIACDSPYTIVQANDINNNDEITATAVVFRERTNITGEVDLDERGNVIEEGMSVAVKLVPIAGGDIENCGVQNDDILDRQGGASGFGGLMLLGLAAMWRRWRK